MKKTEDRAVQGNRFTSCAQLINSLKTFPDWNEKFDAGDYGLMPVGKKFSNLRVVLLEINPKPEWNGEYKLLTRIWGKWFHEMGIDNYCFIKNDNINEVKESMEKFMQVKINGKIDNAQWASVIVTDSVSKKNGNLSQDVSGMTVKKKVESVLTLSNKRSKPAKKSTSRQDEVSFGPLYK